MNLSELPDPLVPAECDCRGLPYMPLEGVRLRESDFVMISTGDEFKAAVLLWCAAWQQVPASSLPDDDRILAGHARVSAAEWAGLREVALRGWEKCSDGRLYHPVIADNALAAWKSRNSQSARASSGWLKRKGILADASTGECDGNAPAYATAMQVKAEVEVEVEAIRETQSPDGDAHSDSTVVAVAPAKRTSRKPGTTIPHDYPTVRDIERAIERLSFEGSRVDANLEAESFRAHAITNDRRCVNWSAAFDNWIVKAITYERQRPVAAASRRGEFSYQEI